MMARMLRVAGTLFSIIVTWAWAVGCCAHPLVEDALDVVIAPQAITIEARVAMEQVFVVAGAGAGSGGQLAAPAKERWEELARGQTDYVRKHLRVIVDGVEVKGIAAFVSVPREMSGMAAYHLDYPWAGPPPKSVQIEQTFLLDHEGWSASCVLRVRQSNEDQFQLALLPSARMAEFGCDWPANLSATQPAAEPKTAIHLGRVIWQYLVLGFKHIAGDRAHEQEPGYDHLLFVTGLVLAARSAWDVVKVVSAFTLAHTLTLVLSVVSEHFRMQEHTADIFIAASIVFVAVQNALWPRQSRGWSRLAVAFGFGLFHGLGFASGLREAMGSLPAVALGAALLAFSVGVEVAHQCVVLPLYGVLRLVVRRRGNDGRLATRLMRIGSCAVALGGVWFLMHALGWHA
jgi:hypothetical protein